MAYKFNTKKSGNFTPAARVKGYYGMERKIRAITIHWWGDPKNKPTHDGVVNYLCRKNGSSSAHEVISAGRVTLLVDHADAAWHAGHSEGNAQTIGLELDPRATKGVYATAAERIAELRAEYGDLPLVPHRHWMATQCPGVFDLDRLDRLARGLDVDKPKPKPKPKPNPDTPAKLVVDGWWGALTTARLQQVLGTPVDGVLSGQYRGSWNRRVPSAAYGSGGSTVIRALQRKLGGLEVDGYLGPKTIKALQRHYGTPVDGIISGPSTVVQAMQKALNKGRI